MKEIQFVKKKDLIVIVILLCISIFIIVFLYTINRNNQDSLAEISVDGTVVATLSLQENQLYTLPENDAITIEIKDGSCAFIHSDCPDKICINTGYLNTPGQSATCLPNRTVLRVISKDSQKDSPDATANIYPDFWEGRLCTTYAKKQEE